LSTTIYVDADGCPVRQEIDRVARRTKLPVVLVSNSWMRVPQRDGVELVVVGDGLDEADDWIAERAGKGDIVVTTDIPLAARCLEKGAYALGPRGHEFTEDTIGEALAGRELSAHLRESGIVTPGARPLEKKDRSRFLQQLDAIVLRARRRVG
jgi:uncharacterized protein YaiI (UPF0178 family)